MVKSYVDPAKQLARIKQREFIQKNLLPFKRPDQIYVLCFPGAENEGEEALEYFEIYKPLGIPPQNITGLEMDPEKCQRLRDLNLGLNVVCQEDIHFLEQAKTLRMEWDIISLDYTWYFQPKSMYAIDLITNDRLMSNTGVLVTNYLGRRDSSESQDLVGRFHKTSNPIPLNMFSFQNAPHEILETPGYTAKVTYGTNNTITQDLQMMVETQSNVPFNLKDNKSETISIAVQTLMSSGKFALDFSALHPWSHLSPEETLVSYLDLIHDDTQPEHETMLEDYNCAYGRSPKEKISSAFRETFMNLFLLGGLHGGIKPFDLFLYGFVHMRPYFLEAHEAYRYISNNGSPMLIDFGLFKTHENRLNRFQNYLLINQTPEQCIIRVEAHETSFERMMKRDAIVQEMVPELGRKAKMFYLESDTTHATSERIFLGSSARADSRIEIPATDYALPPPPSKVTYTQRVLNKKSRKKKKRKKKKNRR